MSERYYTLDVVSERIRITPAALHRYAQEGLVVPSARHGRTPLYSESDLARLRRIVRLTRDLGLNLAGVEVVLRLIDRMDELQREMVALRGEDR